MPVVGQQKNLSKGLEHRLILADYSLSSIYVRAEVRNLQTDPGLQCQFPIQSAIQQQSEYVQIQGETAVLGTDKASLLLSPCKKSTVDCNDLRFISLEN
jgi:hypothetical protein